MALPLDVATAVEALGDGAWGGESHRAWETPVGANGGYLAALILRAMEGELGEPAFDARSLTVHFLRPPALGPLRVEVEVARRGRRVAQLTARGLQDGVLWGTAVAIFGTFGFGDLTFTTAMPQVPGPEGLEPTRFDEEVAPITHRLDLCPVLGAEIFSGSDEPRSGGWTSFSDPQRYDAPALAQIADAWLPVVSQRSSTPIFAPTLDYTVHFRNPRAAREIDPADRILAIFASRHAAEGYIEEDGELWSAEGVLLAQSRQLALLVPLEEQG
ncbi:MAG: hypothetical protein F2796_05095, partial [Actinobacteria bacterium]|nr:hypothetical protein [Actinomycetota bacterium]